LLILQNMNVINL